MLTYIAVEIVDKSIAVGTLCSPAPKDHRPEGERALYIIIVMHDCRDMCCVS